MIIFIKELTKWPDRFSLP